jgi:hypothetical protein
MLVLHQAGGVYTYRKLNTYTRDVSNTLSERVQKVIAVDAAEVTVVKNLPNVVHLQMLSQKAGPKITDAIDMIVSPKYFSDEADTVSRHAISTTNLKSRLRPLNQ